MKTNLRIKSVEDEKSLESPPLSKFDTSNTLLPFGIVVVILFILLFLYFLFRRKTTHQIVGKTS